MFLAIVASGWLAGSILLLGMSLVTMAQPGRRSLAAVSTPRVTATQSIATSTPVPPATPTSTPTQVPTPLPITPFPSALQQEVAAMMAQGRLFYNGNVKLPEMALTFDDGPNPPYTGQVLAILRQYGVKATFFTVGHLVAAYPNSVVQEMADGNLIGNHTWAHPYLPGLSSTSIAWQISTTSDELQRVTGTRPLFFRPPYGAFNTNVLQYANQHGLTTFIWNADPQDWSMPGTNKIITRVLSAARNGAIVLMHDGGGNRSQTVAALPTIIQTLQRRGYRLVTLQQLVNDAHKSATSVSASAPLSASTVDALPTAFTAYDLPSTRSRRRRII